MPLPPFEHSQHGYWIDLERNVHPLDAPQSHNRHPVIAAFPGEGDDAPQQRMQAALDAGYAAISIFGDSFSVRTRAGAVPSGVVGDINRIIKLHGVETITTDHHGAGPQQDVMRNMRQRATWTVTSTPGRDPTYASPWEEIADLRQKLSASEAQRYALQAATNPDTSEEFAQTLVERIKTIQGQYEVANRHYKKSEQIVGDRSLSAEEKVDSLGYWTFHELNRTIWYIGVLLKEIFDPVDKDERK